jgi:hypothetical protein
MATTELNRHVGDTTGPHRPLRSAAHSARICPSAAESVDTATHSHWGGCKVIRPEGLREYVTVWGGVTVSTPGLEQNLEGVEETLTFLN